MSHGSRARQNPGPGRSSADDGAFAADLPPAGCGGKGAIERAFVSGMDGGDGATTGAGITGAAVAAMEGTRSELPPAPAETATTAALLALR